MVKVLDFGLAQALAGDTGSDPSESPTLTGHGHACGRDHGDGGVYEPGTSSRQGQWTRSSSASSPTP